MSEGKVAMISFSALCLTQPCLSAFITTPNNQRGGLMGQLPTLGTSFSRKETTIKRGGERQKKEAKTPQHTRGTRKSSSNYADDQSSLVNSVHLSSIVKNTVLTVVHTLKPSSLVRSLQIHCTGLTGLRSHTSWAWAEKCDPTIIIFCIVFKYVCNNLQDIYNKFCSIL